MTDTPSGPGSLPVASKPQATTDESEHGPRNHRVLIYETRDEQLAAITPIVRQGLKEGNRVMYIADEEPIDDLSSAFEGAGVDVDTARDSGQLTFHSMSETYSSSDEFDVDEMIDFFDETFQNVVEHEEYDRLYVLAEMTWLLDEGIDTLDRLVEYESKLNDFFPTKPLVGICQYNRTRFPSDLLHQIIRAHPYQVYNATVVQNFTYRRPEEFFDADTLSPDVEEFIETHLDRVRAYGQRQEREQTLSALAESSRELLHGDTQAIINQTVTTIDGALSPSITAVFLYDEDTDTLEPETVSMPEADNAVTISLPDRYRDLLWQTFTTDDPQVFSNFQTDAELPSLNTVLQSGITVPLDRHGVLFVGSTGVDAFDESDVEVVQTVGNSAHAALERVEHERTLERQNDQLRQLNQINETIRRIDQALVQASSREEIETVVCNRLAETESYEFAWIGEREPLTDHFVPQRWAGDGEPYLDELYSLTKSDLDDPTSGDHDVIPSPVHTALETGEAYAVQNILTSTDFETWRKVALANGLYSALSIPLTYNEAEYGVLNVYGAEPNVLTEMEQEVLAELGQTVAYAIDAAETKSSLYEDRRTEVELHVTDARSRLRTVATQINAPLDIETVRPEADGELRLFFTTDAPTETVLDAAEELTSVSLIRHIADRGQGGLFEAVVSVGSDLPTVLAPFDVSITHFTARADRVELGVALPQSADVSAFTDLFMEVYPDTDVRSIQRVTRPVQTRGGFYAAVEDRLTDRQLTALRLAYHSGYFEWPRESSGEEVGQSMGVTQSTFSGHLRAGERKLLSLLFAD